MFKRLVSRVLVARWVFNRVALTRAVSARVLAASFASCAALLSAPAMAQAVAPDEMIKGLSNKVIDAIKNDQDIQAGNFKKVSDLVDTTIMPNVNFERMTSLTVGRAWRTATPDQQKKLTSEFRTLLLRTYSGALTQFKDQTVRMKPLRAEAADTEVTVRSEVVPKRGEPIPLDYRLEKSGNTWKIYDVNVANLWLVDTYRNQFTKEINAKGLDGLIADMVAKNKEYEQVDKK